jgi:hypothetical protein
MRVPLVVCMKTYSWLNRNRILSTSRHQLRFLTLLLMAVPLLAFAPQSTGAGSQVPFNAGFSGEFATEFVPPSFLRILVTGEGNASQMGRTSAVTTDELVNLEDLSGTATFTLTGANGDTVVVAMTFQITEVPGGFTTAGDYTVTGGTGRFYGATGTGLVAASGMFTGPTTGVGSFTFAGTISSPGH